MGELKKFDLKYYIDKYNIKTFIETGTYKGDAIKYALNFGFEKIFSIELITSIYQECVEIFKNEDRVILLNDNSINGLKKILTSYNVGITLFWLDAHLPQIHKEFDNSIEINYNKNKDILIPLEKELYTITNNKDFSKDVFIIDDLRIYERGPFERGEWLEIINFYPDGIKFVFDMLDKTHFIVCSYNDEGYIICTPKTF